jgi:uncharacterized membrane protein YphA (DoxX/SURF4 family)
MKRARLALVWILSALIALLMLSQGWDKFLEGGRWAGSFAEWGYPVGFRLFVGVLEIGGGLALLVPRLSRYAALVLTLVMFGAVGALVSNEAGQGALTPLVFAFALMWIWWERRTRGMEADPG